MLYVDVYVCCSTLTQSGCSLEKSRPNTMYTDVSKCQYILQAECVSNIQMSVSQRVESIRGIPILKSNPDLSVIFDVIPIYLTL